MPAKVMCVKLGREAEGLEKPPWPGDLGRRIHENVSKEAWLMWLEEAKKLINETRLDPASPAGQEMYARAMEAYFFGGGGTTPGLKILPGS